MSEDYLFRGKNISITRNAIIKGDAVYPNSTIIRVTKQDASKVGQAIFFLFCAFAFFMIASIVAGFFSNVVPWWDFDIAFNVVVLLSVLIIVAGMYLAFTPHYAVSVLTVDGVIDASFKDRRMRDQAFQAINTAINMR